MKKIKQMKGNLIAAFKKEFKAIESNKLVKLFYATTTVLSLLAVMVGTSPEFMALAALGAKAEALGKQYYGVIIGLSTLMAVVVIATCALLKMVTKNSRTIEEYNNWMKRAAWSWLGINVISLGVTFGRDIVSSVGADTDTPWE